MKLHKKLFLISIALIVGFSTKAQQGRNHHLLKKEVIGKRTIANHAELSIWKYKNADNAFPETLADTLNFPLEGTYALYVSEAGYVSGNNSYGDQVKAEYFQPSQPLYLSSVLIDFAVATSSPTSIEIAVWDNSGPNGQPGNKLTSSNMVLDDILLDILNNQTSLIQFDDTILIDSPFYVGAYLPTTAGDTLVIYSNTDGDTSPATAWEQWSDGNWYALDNPDTWGLEIAHAIFPVVTYSGDLTAAFHADPTLLLPGNTVEFTDASFGSPISWNWTFEGGVPSTSTQQNPTVTYNQTGEFAVQLNISDGEVQDSLIKNNYIKVVDEMPANTDTLLFPLPGTYVVYIITDNGGFVTGNNTFNDKAKANYFELPEAGQVTGVLYDFAWAVGGNPQIELKLWDSDGDTSGIPGSVLASMSLPLDSIKANIENGSLTFFPFDPPVQITHPFYAGFTLPTDPGDTLVAWSNTDGDTNPAIVWDLWNDDTWHHLSATYTLNIAMAVHPIVEYPNGIHITPSTANSVRALPNPTAGLTTVEIQKDEKLISIQVYDVNGDLKLNKTGNTFARDVTLDFSGFPAGNYVVKLITDKQVYSSKVVKK